MTNDYFNKAWAATGQAEGGYANDPHDPGGETNHGITAAVARAHGFKGDMKDLPLDVATEIAKAQYWDIINLDDVASVEPSVASLLFDIGFNCGQATAVRFLQTCLNAFNHNGKDYPDVTVDCLMGKMTLNALRAFAAKRFAPGRTVLLRALNCKRGAYYLDIGNEDEVFGWFLNRIV